MAKAIFPYEKYETIGEILRATSFPKYDDFKSSLKGGNLKRVEKFEELVNKELQNGSIATIRFLTF